MLPLTEVSFAALPWPLLHASLIAVCCLTASPVASESRRAFVVTFGPFCCTRASHKACVRAVAATWGCLAVAVFTCIKTASMQFPGFNGQQLDKAVASLLKYVGNQDKSNQLLEEDEILHLVVSLKKAPVGPRKDKPIRLAIPHPLYTAEGAEICLFVKDHKGEGHKAAKQRLAKLLKNGGIVKVVGLSKLRTKYESHEAKRQLCSSYDLFLADERVIPSLPKLIGKSFFKRKKQPIPVDIRAADFPATVKAACEATYMTPPNGTCISVRVARSSMSQQQIAENAAAALKRIVQHIPKKWSNVQAVYLKTSESVSLPVYQVLPDQPTKIAQQ